jgi:TatA/E family protein of Tat protein translocase
MLPNIGPLEILLLGIVLVILFGPAKLPEIGRSVGRAARDFKDSIGGVGETIETVTEVKSMASPTNLAKAAMPASVKQAAADVTEMKETITDPLGMKKKDEEKEGADGEKAPAADAPKPVADAPKPAAAAAPAAAAPAAPPASQD